MQPKPLMKLFAISLGIAPLMSCGTAPPAQPKSFSAQLATAVNDQRVFDCNSLRPDAIPPAAQQLIDTLPEKLAGETELGYYDRLTPSQRGIFSWFNKEIGEGKRWEIYCRV